MMDEKAVSTRDSIKRKVTKTALGRRSEVVSKLDRLFESDWEVLVVHRDRQTGEFRATTADSTTSPDD